MHTPLFVFGGGLHLYPSRSVAERALAPGGVRSLDAFDASGSPLRLVEGGRGWFGLGRKSSLRLEAGAASAAGRREFRERLVAALVERGVAPPWAEGAPLGALVAEASQRLRG